MEEERAAQHPGVAEGWQRFVQAASLQQGRGVREWISEGFFGEDEAAKGANPSWWPHHSSPSRFCHLQQALSPLGGVLAPSPRRI